MKPLDQPEQVNEYLRDVCSRVKAVELHRDIRVEIGSHLEELADELMAGTPELSRDDAFRAAVAQMGDPLDVGKRLNRIHRPKTDWGLVALLATVIGISLVLMYSADRSLRVHSSIYTFHLFEKKMVFWTLGLALLLGIRLFDYRKLLEGSRFIYWGMFGLIVLTQFLGPNVNGSRHYILLPGGLSVDVIGLSPFVFIVALCGILTHQKREGTWLKLWLTYVLPPLVAFFLVPDMAVMLLYVLAAYLLVALAFKSWTFRIGLPLVHLMGFGLIIANSDYFRNRLSTYLHPLADPLGSGYMLTHSMKTIQTAGWLGNGIGAPATNLPNIYSDMLYPYVISVFGWIGGLAVVWVAALFLLRIAKAAKLVTDPYGMRIVIGLGSLLALKFLWSIGMTLGLLPMVSVQLPFLGFGGSYTVVEMAVIGLIMSVYRRKDMLRRASGMETIVKS